MPAGLPAAGLAEGTLPPSASALSPVLGVELEVEHPRLRKIPEAQPSPQDKGRVLVAFNQRADEQRSASLVT